MSTEKGSAKALKAGIWYTISAILIKAINIITTPIFTRLMETSDYGLAQTFTSWSTLLMIFASLNFMYSIGRAKQDFPGQFDKFIGSLQVLSLFASLLIAAVLIVFIGPLSSFMELTHPLMYLLALALVFKPCIQLIQSKNKYLYNYKGNIAISFYFAFVPIIMTFAFMLPMDHDRYMGKVLGAVIPSVLLSLVFWIVSIRKKTLCINTTYWKYALKISLPLIFHSLSLSLLAQSDRIMITKFQGTDKTAIYSLAYNYAVLINIFLSSVNEAWMPWFHDTLFEGKIKDIREKVKPLIMFGCMLGIGCAALAPEAIWVLGPEDYQAGKWAVGPVTFGIICQYLYQQYVHIELHEKKTQYISLGTMLAGGLNILLNLFFIPIFGYLAAAYTTMFCYFILMFVHLFITRKILHINLYNDRYFFGAMFVSALFIAMFMALYDQTVIRIIVLFLTCIAYLLLNRNIILDYINKKFKKQSSI